MHKVHRYYVLFAIALGLTLIGTGLTLSPSPVSSRTGSDIRSIGPSSHPTANSPLDIRTEEQGTEVGPIPLPSGSSIAHIPSFRSLPAQITGVAPPSGVRPGSGYMSTNWGGYVQCQLMQSGSCVNPGGGNNITAVSGSWIVNSLASTSTSTEYAASWVGIGGWGTSDLVQEGIIGEATSTGATYYEAWWEMLPAFSNPVFLSPDPTISAGDQVYASVEYGGLNSGGYQLWQFTIEDETTASSWTGTEVCGSTCYGSSFSTADWIQESPEVGSSLAQIPAFSSFPFIDPQYYSQDTGWYWNTSVNWVYQQNTAYTSADTVVPSILYSAPDTFYIDYLAGTLWDTIECCSISQSSVEPGQIIQGSMNLSSPDSFSSSSAQNLGLEIGLAVANGSVVDRDASDGAIGFSVETGTNAYAVSFAGKQGLAYGTYSVDFLLWYVPPGGSIGGSGSLLLEGAGGTVYGPNLTVFGPSASRPAAVPLSGQLDQGQNVTFTTSASGGRSPYTYAWSGLPSPCSSMSSPSIPCQSIRAGQYNVSVTLGDAAGATFTSPVLPFMVNTDPSIGAVQASRASADAGQLVSFAANVTGGTRDFTFEWDGLSTSDCRGVTNSTAYCSPTSGGPISISVRATDSAGMSVSSPAMNYVIYPLPTVQPPSASLTSILQGQSVTFTASATLGSGDLVYAWSGLPTGCQSSSSATLTCSPSTTGSWNVSVTVTDSNGGAAVSHGTTITVEQSFLGLPAWEGCSIVGAIVAVLAVLLIVGVRRRSHRRQSSTDDLTIAERVRSYSPRVGPASGTGTPVPATEAWSEEGTPAFGTPSAETGSVPINTVGTDPGSVYLSQPLINLPNPTCWNCHFQNPSVSRYCTKCGVPLEAPPGR